LCGGAWRSCIGFLCTESAEVCQVLRVVRRTAERSTETSPAIAFKRAPKLLAEIEYRGKVGRGEGPIPFSKSCGRICERIASAKRGPLEIECRCGDTHSNLERRPRAGHRGKAV